MEKRVFRMNELRGSDACSMNRDFDFAVKEKDNELKIKAIATLTVIDDYFQGKCSMSNLEEYLTEKMAVVPYLSDEQRNAVRDEVLKHIKRYVNSEKRIPNVAPPAMVEVLPATAVLNGMDVLVTPNYWFANDGGKELEIVKIKCSKPNVTAAQAEGDIGLYSMLKYGQELIKSSGMKGVERIKASYYFLAKQNDSTSADNPNFDLDFFKNTGGLNVVSLSDLPDLDWADKQFKPILEKFIEGVEPHECSRTDCERCNLHEMCKFTEPPIAIVTEQTTKSMKSIKLTQAQKDAIDIEEGVWRINAGAGAGKTAVVALRVVTLLEKGVDPSKICLVTFTNAGAEEMRDRITAYVIDDDLVEGEVDEDAILPDETDKKVRKAAIEKAIMEDAKAKAKAYLAPMTIQTFNAFGDEIIKNEYAKVGFTAPPEVVDDTDRSIIIAKLLNEAVAEPRYGADGSEVKNPLKVLNWKNYTASNKYAKGAITMAKRVFEVMKAGDGDGPYSAADLPQIAHALGADYSRYIRTQGCLLELAMLYDKYDEIMHENCFIEFSDQENLVFEILHDEPFYFEKFGFEHIIVDEFQDSSRKQVEMINLLSDCPTFKSLMVVGDDSQSIYAFRGTTNEYIINLEDYLGCKVNDIMMVENHRSTPEIIDYANAINANNTNRIMKDLVATRPHGKPVTVEGFFTPAEERLYVLNSIKEHIAAGVPYENMAIECYQKTELLEMASLLEQEGIPSVMLNPELLIENSRVIAAIALTYAIQNPDDTKDALVYANADMGGGILSMSEAEISEKLAEVQALIEEFNAFEKDEEKREYLMELFRRIDHNDDEIYQEFLKKLEHKNFRKLFEYVNEFAVFGATTAIRRQHNYPGVVLTTAHSSKGLEWPVVYDMISKYDTQELGHKLENVEERRRLLFVSATRARDELYITAQYTAYGSQKSGYEYNRFLVESYKAEGKLFSISNIETERKVRSDAAKAERAAKRAEKLAKKAKELVKQQKEKK